MNRLLQIVWLIIGLVILLSMAIYAITVFADAREANKAANRLFCKNNPFASNCYKPDYAVKPWKNTQDPEKIPNSLRTYERESPDYYQ